MRGVTAQTMNTEHNRSVRPEATDLPQGFWELDRRLPRWMRRSNAIVRRHLGGFWKATLPEYSALGWILLSQIIVVLLAIPIPGLLEYISLAGLVSLFLLPPSLFIYGRMLLRISMRTSSIVVEERRSETLDILRTTPYSLSSILMSKIAAGIWHQMDDLTTLLQLAVVSSLPIIIIEQATLMPAAQHTPLTQILSIIGLLVSMARLVLEPLMIGSLAVLVSSLSTFGIVAGTWTTILGATYFVLINAPRALPLSWQARLIIESVVPLVLPAAFILIALAAARRILSEE